VELIPLEDLNGNQAAELAVLADHPTGGAQVEIRDSQTTQVLRTLLYGPGKPLQQLLALTIGNGSGGRREVVALLRHGTARIVVMDPATGAAINTLNVGLTEPYTMTPVTDSTRIMRLAVLGKRARDGQIQASVYDVQTNTRVRTVIFDQYGTTVDFRAMPDVNGNGVSELVRLREQPGPQPWFAEIRDGQTGEWITGMYFGAP
jgi:hypothetical protein